ncbi:pyridoxamine 5'-phosphate oxidase [Baekduia soli]|uniref:Pyridoxamine 5'-phosphate oxidase n=1 Tax=Baekduia soli TaxID=496014 RepID=A0A5B8U742_9ACTN|nr:MSMEG_1061 family FMN-dependent PPOX-type flavoprotein [Baekduia soli]QEC48903.1 pyridoxamine 5'-phosphate oxidase [Baekduia soli]
MDPFARPIEDAETLTELYGEPAPRAWTKDIGAVDEIARTLIAASPMVLVASHDADGRCDVTPRGGPPGFVTVLDAGHVALPDATGNRRLDTLRNVVDTGHAGLLFLIPGRDQTLRINGRACVTADPEVLQAVGAVGKPPRTAIVVAADEVYAHCPKAFMRSALWDPTSWTTAAGLPSPAEVMLAHQPDRRRTLAEEQAYLEDGLRNRLA